MYYNKRYSYHRRPVIIKHRRGNNTGFKNRGRGDT